MPGPLFALSHRRAVRLFASHYGGIQLKRILLFLIGLASTNVARAEVWTNSYSAYPYSRRSESAQGVRLTLMSSILEGRFHADKENQAKDLNGDFASAWGLALGYAKLPIQSFGFTTNLAWQWISDNEETFNLARVDGNLAYAVNETLNIKCGPNLSKWVSGEYLKETDPGLGFQFSVGFQVAENMGIDLGYSQMNQSGSFNGGHIDIQVSGVELDLHGTF